MFNWLLENVPSLGGDLFVSLYLLYLLPVIVVGLLLWADSLRDQRLLRSSCRRAFNRAADARAS